MRRWLAGALIALAALPAAADEDFDWGPILRGGVDLEGSPLAGESLLGKVVVVNLWATWCPPCLAEIADLNELVASYDGVDVEFLALTDEEPTEVTVLFKDLGYPFLYRQLTLAEKAIDAYRRRLRELGHPADVSRPQHTVIGRDGRVLRHWVGGSREIGEELAEEIDRGLGFDGRKRSGWRVVEPGAADVAERFLQVTGGEAAWRRLRGLRQRWKGEAGASRVLETEFSSGYFRETVRDAGGPVQERGWDRRGAWAKGWGGEDGYLAPRDPAVTELRELRRAHPLLGIRSQGRGLRRLPDAEEGGRLVHRLSTTRELHGKIYQPVLYGFDAESGLLIYEEAGEVRRHYLEYRGVGEVLIPHRVEIRGPAGETILRLKEIVLDPDLDPQGFRYPRS